MSRAPLAAALLAAAAAQSGAPIDLWPALPPPGENGFACGPEALITTPAAFGTVSRYYNVSVPTLTPFLVHNGSGAAVVIAKRDVTADLFPEAFRADEYRSERARWRLRRLHHLRKRVP